MESPTFTRVTLLTCSGPLVWALHFVFIYGLAGVVCARPQVDWHWLGIDATAWGIGAAGAVALAVIAVVSVRARPRKGMVGQAYFIAYTTVLLGLLSALAVVYETLTIWLVPSCV
jgi:hypothetical protein